MVSVSGNKVFRVTVFVFWICTTGRSSSALISGQLPSIPMIAQFIHQIVKPYIQNQAPNFRTLIVLSPVKEAIQQKIEELKPFLQDSDIPNIEIVDNTGRVHIGGPNQSALAFFSAESVTGKHNALRKELNDALGYAKMRKKILKAIKKDSVSKKTESLISATLDDMIRQVGNNRCDWKTSGLFYPRTNDGATSLALGSIWKQMWKGVRSDLHPARREGIKFLNHFEDFMVKVLNDTPQFDNNYQFLCHVANRDIINSKRSGIKDEQKESQSDKECESFHVCSYELKDFMFDFYTNLNETAVNTLSNYVAMFARDVTSNKGKEKQTIIDEINTTSRNIGAKIETIFKKRIKKFELDRLKRKKENIKIIKDYVRKTTNHAKKQILDDVVYALKSLRPKLLINIKKDIAVNLDVDLGNLVRELHTRICVMFSSCNGNVARRRHGIKSSIDKNSVLLQVELSLDVQKTPNPYRRISLNVGQAMNEDSSTNNSVKLLKTEEKISFNLTRTSGFKTTTPVVKNNNTETKTNWDKGNSQINFRHNLVDDDTDTMIIESKGYAKAPQMFYRH